MKVFAKAQNKDLKLLGQMSAQVKFVLAFTKNDWTLV